MANYFNLQYEDTAVTSPGTVELAYGNPTSNGLTIPASIYAGSGFTPTHYKMWGVELVEGEGTRLVAVEPGFFADGFVEVSGDISAGDTVVIP